MFTKHFSSNCRCMMLCFCNISSTDTRWIDPTSCPTVTESQSGKTGAWVYKDTKVEQEVWKPSIAYFDQQFQISAESGFEHQAKSHEAYWRGYGKKEDTLGTIDTKHAWTVPPQRIAGDSEIAIELEAAATVKQPPTIDLGKPCGTNLLAPNNQQLSSADAQVSSTLKQKYTFSRVTAKQFVGKGGKAGDEFRVRIHIPSPGGAGKVEYIYQWDPKAPATTSTYGNPDSTKDNTGGGKGTGTGNWQRFNFGYKGDYDPTGC